MARLGIYVAEVWCLVLMFYVCTGSDEDVAWQREMAMKAQNATLQRLWKELGPNYDQDNLKANQFPCSNLSPSPRTPTSVHALRPGDIKVIGAMGDSLTAGTGITAKTIFGVLIQNRGLSWSGGGEETFESDITLPNVLKRYNPGLYGYATCNGDEDSKDANFNVAVSGSKSSDLVNQARKLVDRMRNDKNVDFQNDWKLVTILSGNNDLCDYCKDPNTHNAENYRQNILAALDLLQAELPRTLVNLVEPLNMEIVTQLNKGLLCSALHFFLCDCAAFPKNDQAEKDLIRITDEYQKVIADIALSGRYDSSDTFTVVLQPFFEHTFPPEKGGQPDMSYFAPDCFHLSKKGQEVAASALWNNMVEKVSEKRTKWAPGEAIECPTEAQPFIYTNKNSRSLQMAGTQQQIQDGGLGSGAVIGTIVVVVVILAIVVAALINLLHHRRLPKYESI